MSLNREIVACRACPRLVAWRELVARERKKAYKDWDYWGKPVPNFGDPEADRLIVGLAPAAHGANRTGRMFTGDRSGDWLFRALHKAGVASQPWSQSADDSLELKGVLITAAVHCAPPGNKPLPSEFANCRHFLDRTIASRKWKAILCLGSIAWTHTLKALGEKSRHFGHGKVEVLPHSSCGDGSCAGGGEGKGVEVLRCGDAPPRPVARGLSADAAIKLVASYHPSQQNTFTGKLTEAMLDAAIREFLTGS